MTTPSEQHWFKDPDAHRSAVGSRADDRAASREGHADARDTQFDRRSFLRLVGFSVAAAGVSGCSPAPPQTVMALFEPPVEIVPGRAYWIATTSWADGSGSGVLVRCRDGRPIKVEGNPSHPVNQGGLTAACQASLLALYDSHRFDGPRRDGAAATWDEVDTAVRAKLDEVRSAGGTVRLLTSTLTGPSTLEQIDALLASVPDGRHVMYDALSCSALLDAQQALRGVRVLPRYDFSRAKVLAAFDADVLGTWISPAGFAADRQQARDVHAEPPRMSRHWQLEARLSLTGTRADRRVRLAPWETTAALAELGSELAGFAGVTAPGPRPDASALPQATRTALHELAQELWAQRTESLVVCGTNARDAQLLTAWINAQLGSEGTTFHLDTPSLQRQGDDAALQRLRDELLTGAVDLLIVAGANPAYDLPDFAEALGQAGTLVSLASLPDETSALATIVCPEPHELERWDDAEPIAGLYSTTQPTVPALRDTRTLRASLARWRGDARDDRELLVDHWRRELDSRRPSPRTGFDAWFHAVLERGWTELPSAQPFRPAAFRPAPVAAALTRIAANAGAPADGALGLVLHPKVGLLDGRGAHNPWLQELPDPVTKVVWDNHVDLSPATAERLGLRTGDIVTVSATDDAPSADLTLPVLVQPGQDDRVAAIALGYGRAGTDRFTAVGPEWLQGRRTVEPGGTIGANVAPWLRWRAGALDYSGRTVRLTATGGRHELAITQDHHNLSVPAHLAPPGGEVRDAVRLVTFPQLQADPEHVLGGGHTPVGELWDDDHIPAGHHWGMAIDLSACTGCSACVVGCQAENNIPVVGRDEVRRHREMSWLRIDRYYADQPDGGVDVVHQPMMCQHCAHAPCETVCPVLATMHSSEGLNTQVYNRCVGTRYCANNCPYKTRRFNWFDYAHDDQLLNMVLNPEVTIRSRGVMEKCSLCVQRIQGAKALAGREGRELADGDIQTACQQSCPTRAITFGDLNDPNSALSRRIATGRSYRALEELNVQPGVHYLADVRNDAGSKGGGHG